MAVCLQINQELDLSGDDRISQAHFILFFISYKQTGLVTESLKDQLVLGVFSFLFLSPASYMPKHEGYDTCLLRSPSNQCCDWCTHRSGTLCFFFMLCVDLLHLVISAVLSCQRQS